MKRFLPIILVISAICCGHYRINARGSEQTPTVIIISTDGPSGEVPRMPVPISGYVFDSTIYLIFLNNVGYVNISLYESSTGLVQSTVVDSSNNPIAIPFCGEPGSYSLSFDLEDGYSYKGRFII